MKDAPAFDFYPERWTHGTRGMTKTERSDYLDLLCLQWTEDGLPDSNLDLARLCGYRESKSLSLRVVAKFPVSIDGKRRNERLEVIRNEQRKRIDDRRKGAAKTNAKRSLSGRSVTIQRHADGVVSATPPPTTHPVLLKKEPKGVFEETIYQAYPLKVGKPAAMVKIRMALENPPEGFTLETWPDELLNRTVRYAGLRKDEPYTPHPATWFHQCRFNDDPVTWKNAVDSTISKPSGPNIAEVKKAVATIPRAPALAVIPESERPDLSEFSAAKAALNGHAETQIIPF